MGNISLKEEVCAGIVTYNPNIDLMINCIDSICSQVSRTIIVDNGSANADEIIQVCNKFEHVELIENQSNKGIACALNQIAKRTKELGKKWFLTLDQDSICDKEYIERFSSYTHMNNIAIVCPRIQLRVLKEDDVSQLPSMEYVETAITSGSLIDVRCWEKVGGFWEFLFIDKVDDDFCYSVKRHGMKIIRVNSVVLEHEIGKPQLKRFFWKKFYSESYPAFRYYYYVRNSIIVYACHKDVKYKYKKILITKAIKIVLCEKNKMEKLKAFYSGFIDGCRWKKDYGKWGSPFYINE